MERKTNKRQKPKRRAVAAALVVVAMLLNVPVASAAQSGGTTKIERFEGSDPVYTVTVAVGADEEGLGLPESLRAVVALEERSLEGGTFVQAQAEAQEAEEFGYIAPENASELYESEQLVVYETEEQEYRVYGSVDGGENLWFACVANGNMTGVVLDVPVTWNGGYDLDSPGEYVLTASFSGYTYSSDHPSAVITVEAVEADADADASLLVEGSEDPEDGAYISQFEVTRIQDGTADFDTETDDKESEYYYLADGNDENESNGRVRSFDTVTYDLHYVLASHTTEDEYESATIYFEFLLPLSATEAEWDIEAMSWIETASYEIVTKEYTYDFDGDGEEETVSCQVLRGSRHLLPNGTSTTVVPGSGTLQAVVQVLAAKNGTVITPVFTAWLDGNQAGDTELKDNADVTGNEIACSTHNQVEQMTVAANAKYDENAEENTAYAVTVTAALRLNVQITGNSNSYTASGTYNFNEGNEYALDKGAGDEVIGDVTSYGITLQLYNHADRGFKGIELPEGDITFDLTLSTKYLPIEGDQLTDEQQAEVQENYAPLVLSWGPQGPDIYDKRTLTDFGATYAMSAAPENSGMKEVSSSGSASCYNGGTWTASKSGNTISITVSDYEISYPLFPNANYGNSKTSSDYYSVETGLENIGCFSAAKFFILTPFYNSDTGEYVAEEYGAGNFYTTVKDIRLNATSVSGQELDKADDNSNQMKTTDDSVTSTVALHREGGYTLQVMWTQLDYFEENSSFCDVLGRNSSDAGTWYANGQDVLVRGSAVGIGSGIIYNEGGDSRNRLYAADVLCKFDGSAVTLTEETAVNDNVGKGGFEATLLYATKKDGKNWVNDEEMNDAKIEDLVYYSSLDDVPEEYVVVAYLVEYRPVGNDPDNIKKIDTGATLRAVVGATVNTDEELVGSVYQCVIGAKIWTVSEWDACGGNIPSMLGHNVDGKTVTLPETTNTNYPNYEKAYYDESGYAGGHTGDFTNGDSLLIVKAMTAISQSVAQVETDGNTKSIYQLDNGQRYVDYVLSPSFIGMPDGVTAELETVTITVTLGEGLTYVPGSAYFVYEKGEESYIPSDTQGQMGTVVGGIVFHPDVTNNDDGTTTLTWVLTDVNTNEALPTIYYSAVIGVEGDDDADVAHNDTLNSTATITCEGELRDFNAGNGNLASTNITVAKLLRTALSKVVNPKWYDPGDDITFTLNAANQSSSSMEMLIMDNLPYNDDSRGSSFTGKITVQEVQILPDKEEDFNVSEWSCYYTTSEAARDTLSSQYNSSDITDNPTSYIGGEQVIWTKATVDELGTVTGIPSDGTVTAIVWVGTLKAQQTFHATVTLRASEAEGGDVIINGLSRGEEHTIARVYIAQRTISGLAWLDSNEDGLRDDGEELLEGITVQLLKLDETSGEYELVTDTKDDVVSVVTQFGEEDSETYTIEYTNNNNKPEQITITAIAKEDGSYEFAGLPTGTYAVRFTSSNSVSVGKFIASPVDQGSDYIDSDGVPLYDDGTQESTASNRLVYTQITGIKLPSATEMSSAYYVSRYHDSGFYYSSGGGGGGTTTNGSVKITKTVTGDNAPSDDVAYEFKVWVRNGSGTAVSESVSYRIAHTDGTATNGSLTIGTDGYTFYLKDGESITFSGITSGRRIEVTEISTGDFATTTSGLTDGVCVISSNTTKSVEFFNDYGDGTAPGGDPDPNPDSDPTPTDPDPELDPAPTEPGTPDTPTEPGRPVDDIPQTGDETNIAAWATLAGFSLLGMLATVLARRRRRYRPRHSK